MAPEKQTSKPPLPTLAARQPLTPKMATRTTPRPQVQTPLLTRRNTRPEPALGNATLADELPAFLGSNITPRSGQRQSRVDSANSTPTGTPSLDRGDSWEARAVGTSHDDANPSKRKPAVTFATAGASSPDAKFFYASEASKAQALPSRPVLSQAKSSFFYANGGLASTAAAPASTCAQPGPSKLPSTSRPGTATSSPAYNMQQRPASPVKLPSYSGPSKHTFGSTNTSARSPVVGSMAPFGVMPNLRRTSSEAQQGRLQTPSSIAEPAAVARLMSEHGSYPPSTASSPQTSQTSVFGAFGGGSAIPMGGFASLLQAAEEFSEEEQPDHEEDAENKEVDGSLLELVANARRERKVQDLQITNASLEAINRTLERQLRKQTAELRRYRRLSRSGRLSLMPEVGASESGSGGRRHSRRKSTGGGGALGILGASVSSEESEDGDDDDESHDCDEDSSDDDDAEFANLSPAAVALRDARHRERDEARLRLDLSKHQQLLVDSQQMNQRLRRCLGWTEELIKEGRRALEYRVRVSEVELGGRVLAPEEVEGDETEPPYRDSGEELAGG